MNSRRCLSKNERKKQSFKSRITQRFIFILFTTHFNIHQSLFTTFFIHEKTIVFDEFQKEFHKEFDLDSESIEVIDFTDNNAKTSMSRMKNARFLAWRKTFTVVNDKSSFSRCFLVSNAIMHKSLHRRWLNQSTQKSKNEARKFIQKKNSIKKCSSHSMNSLFNYWNSNL
jgi:hypothetical protein